MYPLLKILSEESKLLGKRLFTRCLLAKVPLSLAKAFPQ